MSSSFSEVPHIQLLILLNLVTLLGLILVALYKLYSLILNIFFSLCYFSHLDNISCPCVILFVNTKLLIAFESHVCYCLLQNAWIVSFSYELHTERSRREKKKKMIFAKCKFKVLCCEELHK